jgi:geranylgeranyl pyrophosphate synthase
VKSNGAISQCLRDARDYADLAEQHLSLFPESPEKESLLRLNRFVIDRDH